MTVTFTFERRDSDHIQAYIQSPDLTDNIPIGCVPVTIPKFLVGLSLLGVTEVVQQASEEVLSRP